MTLAYAARAARALVDLLAPHCELIEIVGSIRRGRPEPNDIDILCLPRRIPIKDLLGATIGITNPASETLRRRAAEQRWVVTADGVEYFSAIAGKPGKFVKADLWWADAATWPSLLLCKTGSAVHNIQLSTRAQHCGLHWRPNIGLEHICGLARKRLDLRTEAALYERLGLPFIEPKDRENIAEIIYAHPVPPSFSPNP